MLETGNFEDRGSRALKLHFAYSQNFLTRTWSQLTPSVLHTASIKDEYGQSAVLEGSPDKQADPFDYGGSLIDPN